MTENQNFIDPQDDEELSEEYSSMLGELPIMNDVSKAIRSLKQVDWFHKVGDAIDQKTNDTAYDYMCFLGFNYAELHIVPDWDEVFPIMETNNYQTGAWEVEEGMRASLTFHASEQLAPDALDLLFQFIGAGISETIDDHITEAFAIWDLEDEQLKMLMMGTAMQACHTYVLAKIFGDDDQHPFILRMELYRSGHWPLGFTGDSLALF